LKIPYIVQLKFLECVTFATAEDFTEHCTLDCSVCCVLKARSKLGTVWPAQLKLNVKLYVCGARKNEVTHRYLKYLSGGFEPPTAVYEAFVCVGRCKASFSIRHSESHFVTWSFRKISCYFSLPALNLEGHPAWAVIHCFYTILATAVRVWVGNLKTRPAVLTDTDLTS
jgi:hypothetical protein